ncbi:hypothetical protein FNV43_RR22245 [Rhamnella rubrinervis]|uniref:RRM domain-containing protein n=1 Tax=Rhamnella rubrinervis TaxID=2594499 RepID=A0A8K0DTY5_9ROSA|nr:hypothetical protein FNV43_RR22245 [Rhamnella rubrinervis]
MLILFLSHVSLDSWFLVLGLSFYTANEQLKALFSPFGVVTEARLVRDPKTQRPKGFGFVTFKSEVEAHKALKAMNCRKLNQNLLRKLEIELWSARRVLNDAEKKQLTDPAVREWLNQLKDAIYDAEDLVFEISTEAKLSELEAGRSGSHTLFQVQNFSSSSKFTVPNIEERIEEIHSMLKYIVEKKDMLGLREGDLETRPFPKLSEAPLVNDSDIYGRDADKETILKFLLSEEVGDGDNKVSIIPIVGMGYSIRRSDVFALSKSIYEAVTMKSPDGCIKPLFQLQLQLEVLLRNKKFLFVFDDVWNLNYQRWSDLKRPLQSAAHGSKIIVTTRSREIASVMGSVSGHELQMLSDENCWRLFAKHVFNNVEPSGVQELEAIGSQIVKKCKGLPLAIKSLGCLLHSERSPQEWENVLKNDIWELPERECNILPALWLSYYYLPPHLKRCFAYCSIFPKDYIFEKENLILLWMAEDLLQPHKHKTSEEVGEGYFKDLTSRSFFHHVDGWFSMHDLMNDLANFVSGESCLMLDGNYSERLLRKTRYLSIDGYKVRDMKKIEEVSKNKVLRTLLVLKGSSFALNEHYKKYPKQLQSMRCLRALSAFRHISTYEKPHITKLLDSIGGLKLLRIEKLPDSIGNLKHLRHLDLFFTRIEKLPDTICGLHELHSLNLGFCKSLSRLPTNITTLIHLRHLNIGDTSIMITPQVPNLKILESLNVFVVGKNDEGPNIRELDKLQYLRGDFSIERLENVENVGDVSEANLKDKMGITDLKLVWNDESDDSHKPREILNRLRPHTNLEGLWIENYGSTNFPDWVGHHSFSCVTRVNLKGCKNCYLLPALGQLPSLEMLCISGFDMLESIGEEFYYNGSSSVTKPFKSLKWMSFSDTPQWKEWLMCGSDEEEGGVFSKVELLILSDCEMINGACLPDDLPSLKELRICGRNQLLGSLSTCHYPSLLWLTICGCGEVESFPRGTLPSTITHIEIRSCQKLVSLSEEGWPSNLESISIDKCGKLFADTNFNKWNLRSVTSLTSLRISEVPDEVGDPFPEEGQFPTTLTSFQVEQIPSLKSLNANSFSALQKKGCASWLSVGRSVRGIGEDWYKIYLRIEWLGILCLFYTAIFLVSFRSSLKCDHNVGSKVLLFTIAYSIMASFVVLKFGSSSSDHFSVHVIVSNCFSDLNPYPRGCETSFPAIQPMNSWVCLLLTFLCYSSIGGCGLLHFNMPCGKWSVLTALAVALGLYVSNSWISTCNLYRVATPSCFHELALISTMPITCLAGGRSQLELR